MLQELGTKPIRQVMRVSLELYLYVKKNSGIEEYFLTVFGDMSVPVTSVSGRRYVQVVLENQRHCTALPFK